MTPELPLAPRSIEDAATSATSETVRSSPKSSSSRFAALMVIKSDTFGTTIDIDFIHFCTFINGIIWALG